MKKSTSRPRLGLRSNPWQTARKASQVLFLAAVLVLLIQAPTMGESAYWNGLILRIDPLSGLAAWLSGGVEPLGAQNVLNRIPVWAWAGLGLGLGLVLGRAWCGWLCPLGTLLDWFTPRGQAGKRAGERRVPEALRKVKYLLLALILGSAMLGLGGVAVNFVTPFRGSLPLLVLDPLSIFIRAFAGFWPALNAFVTWLEMALYTLPVLQPSIAWLDGVLRPSLLPLEMLPAKGAGWGLLLLALVLGLNWIVPRFWCRYICPLGGLLGLFSRFAFLRRVVEIEDCTGCKLCARACPTGTIDAQRQYASDPAECTLCLDCLPACPRGDTAFRWVNPFQSANLFWPDYDPTRRQVLAAIGVGLAAATLTAVDPAHQQTRPGVLRPPGATEAELLSQCVRCGVCVRSCPTAALQPAISQAGFEGLFTPLFMPRLGYCDFSCHACGLACPEGAIPPLSLEEKRTQVIGIASIDEQRCLPWSGQAPCIVCEEMCPLPKKAIWLEEKNTTMADGSETILQLPHVIRESCIGCGICEYKCPVVGEAAIRVGMV